MGSKKAPGAVEVIRRMGKKERKRTPRREAKTDASDNHPAIHLLNDFPVGYSLIRKNNKSSQKSFN